MTDDNYLKWKTEPTPENMSRVVSELDPVINSEIHRYDGPRDLLRGRARVIAAESVRSYDPESGAALKTWVTGNLKGLTRYSRQLRPVHVPEQATRRVAELARIQAELGDRLGHDPSVDELADETGLSREKVKWLQHRRTGTISESEMESEVDSEAGSLPGTVKSHKLPEFVDSIYASLPDRDKSIFDMKTGRKGGAAVPNQIIAKRLGLSPAYVSQRSKEIAQRIAAIAAKREV